MVLVDLIVNACIELYKKLPKTGKPSANEWTVISAIVAVFDKKDVKVLSLGTGSKCIGKSSMSSKGDILNDSHSEVIARRAFLRYLYLQIIQLNSTNTSEVLEKTDSKFFVKNSVKFYFVTGMPPCGDASIMPKAIKNLEDVEFIGSCLESQKPEITKEPQRDHKGKRASSAEDLSCKKVKAEHSEPEADIHRTGAKCLPQSAIQDPHLPGLLYHSLGAVRTKPGRGDPTLSLSCSDKIARWNCVGWQGALLSLFIENPVFVEAIICAGNCPFSKESLDRALNERINRENFILIHQSNISFPDIKFEGRKPNPSSIIWCNSGAKEPEVSINGRRLGVTKKNLNKKIARTSVCKKELLVLFEKALDSLPEKHKFLSDKIQQSDINSLKQIPYGELKLKAVEYQNKWIMFKEKYFKVWTNKPKELLNFTSAEDEDN